MEAVNNGWLADYRIIAVGVNGDDVYDVANRLAQNTQSKGRNRLTTPHFLRGMAFALAMGGATHSEDNGSVPIKSCIGFMNTVDKSKNLARDLQQPIVRDWLQSWLNEHSVGQVAAAYSLEHLDATSNVSQRENGKRRLAAATAAQPHGIINVGIFGEGTPRIPQEPHRRHTGRWPRHAHGPRQVPGLHHLPVRHPSQRRCRIVAQQQLSGGGVAGVGADTPSPARPRPTHRREPRRAASTVPAQGPRKGAYVHWHR